MPLRKLIEADLHIILSWRNAIDVFDSMFAFNGIGETDYFTTFARMQHDTQARYYLHLDEKDNPDGVVYFSHYQSDNRTSFWGGVVELGSSAEKREKLGLDGLDEAFFQLNINKLNVEVISTNERDLHFYEKLGFSREGFFHSQHFDGKGFVDIVRLGLLKSEWVSKRSEIQISIARLSALAHLATVKVHTIMFLSDPNSWLNFWVYDLVDELQAAGHKCFIAHRVTDLVPAVFCFCLSFSEIVSAKVRKQFKHTLVVHESDLPKGRGWSPMSWQILEGKQNIPVTLLECEDSVDAGPIYLQEWIKLDGSELSPGWRKLQAEATKRLCLDFISEYPSVLDKAKTQNGKPTFYPRRRLEDSKLDPLKPLSEQFNLLRVVDNDKYPAFFEINGKKFILKIKSTEAVLGI